MTNYSCAKRAADPSNQCAACTACKDTKQVYGGEVCKFCDEPAPRRLTAADVNEIWLGCRSVGGYAHRHEFASAIMARIFGDKP
jgi:hypothetical protein